MVIENGSYQEGLQYNKLSRLGQGTFGDVFLIQDKVSNMNFVAKQVSYFCWSEKFSDKIFTREPKTNVPCCGRQLSVTKVVSDFMINTRTITNIAFPTSLVHVRSHCVLFISSLVLCQCHV